MAMNDGKWYRYILPEIRAVGNPGKNGLIR